MYRVKKLQILCCKFPKNRNVSEYSFLLTDNWKLQVCCKFSRNQPTGLCCFTLRWWKHAHICI